MSCWLARYSFYEDMGDLKRTLLQDAKLAGQAERYEFMAAAMKELIESGMSLTLAESKLFAVAYENVVGALRHSLRVLSSCKQHSSILDRKKMLREVYQQKIAQELMDTCKCVLNLLDDHLIPSTINQRGVELRVFYLKMKGDHHRYLSEITTGATKVDHVKEAASVYSSAMSIAYKCKGLPQAHPYRLALYLNYSVFLYKIEDKPVEAYQLAKKAFDNASCQLRSIPDDWYNDSARILDKIRKNLDAWKEDSEEVNTYCDKVDLYN